MRDRIAIFPGDLGRQIEELTRPELLATLANDTLAVNLRDNRLAQLTVTADRTLTTTIAPAGTLCHLIILTTGTTSRTITFGTGFRTTGTLATGTADVKKFIITFLSDGVTMLEVCRTGAM